jgi:hypothetical protein
MCKSYKSNNLKGYMGITTYQEWPCATGDPTTYFVAVEPRLQKLENSKVLGGVRALI